MKTQRMAVEPLTDVAAVSNRREQILAVGLSTAQLAELPSRLFGAMGRSTVTAEFRLLTPKRLDSAMAVLSPLVGRGFDAVDIATVLNLADFRGRYYAFAPELPDVGMITDEVSQVAPNLAFEVIATGEGPHLVR